MRKFIFRLETLLKTRSVHEVTLKRDLAQAYQKGDHIKERERMLQAQIAALMDEIQRKRQEGKLDLQETYHQILEHLQGSLNQVQHTLWAQEGQIEEHKKRLQQALQERKVIEKIKEKHYNSWLSCENQREDALCDELSCQKRAD